MEFESFKNLIHESWWGKLKPFIESESCDKIYAYLKKESKRGKINCPLASNVWKAFLLTPYDDVKCILIGMSPYHTLYKGAPIADGILMSCSITGRLQPSLDKFYQGMFDELGLDAKTTPREPDLSFLASQGVLMLNTSLTCEAMKPGSHNIIWTDFMKYLFEEVLLTTGIPVVFLGKESTKVERYLSPFTWVIKVAHPAAASYSGGDWQSEGLFTQVNKILQGNNGTEIQWYKTK